MMDLETNYLVIGAGAMGLAFADTLVAETGASVTIVDRYDQPGGHWTRAYPFVRLHQPSAGYGVNSRPLGNDAIDSHGPNAGLLELAGTGEICSYFDQVMQQTLLPSGRVRYLPMTEHLGGGRCRSLVTGEAFSVTASRRIVDATYQNVTVPAMRTPPYAIDHGVTCVPPNALTALGGAPDRFTVVGAGKTGIDTCLWLLRRGVDPQRLTWIMPRDSWLIDRTLTQPGPAFADRIVPVLIGQLEAVAAATSVEDLYTRLEACGRLIRVDPTVKATMYRCATVSQSELVELRRIEDVVRLGRVRRIGATAIELDGGSVPTTAATLHIDCSADGLERRPEVPVFDGGAITLQSVRTCQQVFSAAFIAHVEAAYPDDAVKNDLCRPIAHPDTDLDFLRTTVADDANERRWAEDPALQSWLDGARLNWIRHVGPALPEEPAARAEALAIRRAVVAAMAEKLRSLMST
ncbi:NAD(P)-binding protein [Glacieibacterium frigidum]|uniref:NAD(P)/FAD-dependent oxidoreductase n=1 Tax=Glacieibacterium frigidum TaxID=2593303 RepID=A0A552U9Q2_9SPHN|nr:NAD(P)-binding protein [Glacieibacterium frigidum]TRW14942.1 NAD(P)/FAD-dependent oxidoreductase [Glacieibacterium frigidum]